MLAVFLKDSGYKTMVALSLIATVMFIIFSSHEACVLEKREIAITIDDLPIENRYFKKIVNSLKEHNAPATGFVIANRMNDEMIIQLQQFKKDGFIIGSHTYSHFRLSKTSAEDYIEDIQRADKILAPFISEPKYFRYPHLSKGKGEKCKKVNDYLTQMNYIVAPVTIDSKDFKFNVELLTRKDRENPTFLNQLKQRYLDFVWTTNPKGRK